MAAKGSEFMALRWNEKYLVGHAEIDSQHERLFELVLCLVSARSREMQVLCAKNLFDDVREHFAFENQLMAEDDYPEAEGHLQLHKILLSKLDKMTHEIADRSLNVPKSQMEIVDWLINHMTSADVDLAAFIRASSSSTEMVHGSHPLAR
jgi:hemerythrin-like metal-binding protein